MIQIPGLFQNALPKLEVDKQKEEIFQSTKLKRQIFGFQPEAKTTNNITLVTNVVGE